MCTYTAERVDLLVKFPTRERPDQFFNYLDQYYKLLSGEYSVYFLISCDEDDCSMNNEAIRAKFKEYPNLEVVYGTSESKIHACNRDMENAPQFDAVLLASDDMLPVKAGYDKSIIENMRRYYPELDGTLNFDDGHKEGSFTLHTYPVLGWGFYKRFNYIYNTEYISFFSHLELAVVARVLQLETMVHEELLTHNNPIFTHVEDELYKRNSVHFEADKETYRRRHDVDFDMKLSKKEKRISKGYSLNRWGM